MSVKEIGQSSKSAKKGLLLSDLKIGQLAYVSGILTNGLIRKIIIIRNIFDTSSKKV
jgi:hypothetical protein